MQEMNRVTQENAASAEELASIMAVFVTNDRMAPRKSGTSVDRGITMDKAHWSARSMPDEDLAPASSG